MDPPLEGELDEGLDATPEEAMDGGSFVLNIRTARCVASQTVPRSRTIPRTISAPMALARSNGDSSEVTYSVARTRTNIAPSVIATIKTVVTIEAKIVFIRPPLRPTLCREVRIAQEGSVVSFSAQTGPVVGNKDGINGIGGIVLDARGLTR